NDKHEGWDGKDTIEWIAQQSWYGGDLVTVGGSFSAANQQALALEDPKDLRAQILRDCGTNYYERMFRQHGACNIGVILCWLASQAHLGYEVAHSSDTLAELKEFNEAPREWIERLPLTRGSRPFGRIPEYENIYFSVLEN